MKNVIFRFTISAVVAILIAVLWVVIMRATFIQFPSWSSFLCGVLVFLIAWPGVIKATEKIMDKYNWLKH